MVIDDLVTKYGGKKEKMLEILKVEAKEEDYF